MVFKEGGGGQIVSFLKKKSATMVGRRRKFLCLLCPRRPYIELFCVEQKVNNTWNIPFFIEQKTVN